MPSEPERKVRRLMVGQDGCGGCDEAKEAFAADLKSGALEYVDAYSERGQKLVTEGKLRGTPEFLTVDEKDRILGRCKPKQKGDSVFLSCDLPKEKA